MPNRPMQGMRRLNYLIAETDAVYHELAHRLGVADSTLQILYTICDAGADGCCPLPLICRWTGVNRQTVYSAVRKLQAEGLVHLQASDAKSKLVCLTPQGWQLARRTALPLQRLENEILAAWPKQDVEVYLALTERFLLDLKEKGREGLTPMEQEDP